LLKPHFSASKCSEDYTKRLPFSASPAHCVAGHAPQVWPRASISEAQLTRIAGKRCVRFLHWS